MNWNRAWGHWVKLGSLKLGSLKMKSSLFKCMHDAWLTGEIAVRRHKIIVLPKCPLCKNQIFSKVHIITQCSVSKQERESMIQTINTKQMYNKTNLLYLDGNFSEI